MSPFAILGQNASERKVIDPDSGHVNLLVGSPFLLSYLCSSKNLVESVAPDYCHAAIRRGALNLGLLISLVSFLT